MIVHVECVVGRIQEEIRIGDTIHKIPNTTENVFIVKINAARIPNVSQLNVAPTIAAGGKTENALYQKRLAPVRQSIRVVSDRDIPTFVAKKLSLVALML